MDMYMPTMASFGSRTYCGVVTNRVKFLSSCSKRTCCVCNLCSG